MSTKKGVANRHAGASTVYQKVDIAANNDMAVNRTVNQKVDIAANNDMGLQGHFFKKYT